MEGKVRKSVGYVQAHGLSWDRRSQNMAACTATNYVVRCRPFTWQRNHGTHGWGHSKHSKHILALVISTKLH